MRVLPRSVLCVCVAAHAITTAIASTAVAHAAAGDDPFADAVVSYNAGSNASPGYTNPATALGSPERFTGESIFPSVVSPFSPPFGSDEIVSIGSGGHIVLAFNTPVADDPDNLFGIDLIIFNNTGFIDDAYPNGIVGGVFGADGGTIEVSADGIAWHAVTGAADGPMPTLGYTDSGPYDDTPGTQLTDFTRPLDPALTPESMTGLTHAQVVALYGGAGGGVGIDIAATKLAAISFIRITNPAGPEAIEIDAVSDASPRIPGDVNLDGVVDVNDLLALIGAWGPVVPGGPPADLNGDGVVDVNDLLILIRNWS